MPENEEGFMFNINYIILRQMDIFTIGYLVILVVLLTMIPLFIFYRNGKGRITFYGMKKEYHIGGDMRGQIEIIAKRELRIRFIDVAIKGKVVQEIEKKKYNPKTGKQEICYKIYPLEVFYLTQRISTKKIIPGGDSALLSFEFSGDEIKKQIDYISKEYLSQKNGDNKLTLRKFLRLPQFQSTACVDIDCTGIPLEKTISYKMYV
ncbi:MAG: hypothetical protein GY828_01505 [Candidatus Gracilibacteria bacterium]|nr:hypothetical protein [Candidatus Gracilibacteria bacterium]